MQLRFAVPFAALACACAMALSACVPNATDASPVIDVHSTADACKLSTTEVAAGSVAFTIFNDGDDVTEFYILAEDGLRIVAEVENIGPGISRDLVVSLPEGKYL